MDKATFERNELLAQGMIKSLEKRNFCAYYAKNSSSAKEIIKNIISKDETISWGGSMTLDEMGLKEELENENYTLFDRDKAKTEEERKEIILKSMTSDVFLMSANAITQDGEIVNIDGHGNRLSALCFGPKRVIMIIGMNKVTKSLDDAISRARNFAAPVNAKRVSAFFDIQTPCITTGACHDCKSQTSICTHILTTRLSYPKGRITVILVNEDLGY